MGEMVLRIWDVEHGACAMLWPRENGQAGRLAMVDSGDNTTEGWCPSYYIRQVCGRDRLDYLFVTNADQDHLSDLDGLWDEGIAVGTLTRNPHPSSDALRRMKEQGGGVTRDMERYLGIHGTYTAPVLHPFDTSMGGITHKIFFNTSPPFNDTNNLSLAVFFKFGDFKILFPGDLEEAGWLALLQQPDFVQELRGTNILVASHHGRENGYCEEIFRHFTPQAVVMSDKAIVHDTQRMTDTYRAKTSGVLVAPANTQRHVLTTRRDGHITFVTDGRGFDVYTECGA